MGSIIVYICPNIYLVRQTTEQARKFGIDYCVIGEDRSLPVEFLNSGRILICHVQKMFNGFTKFGLNKESVDVGGLILDDSHACIDSIKDAFTLKIPREIQAYTDILEIFEEDLERQGRGTFFEINAEEASSFLPVPYWTWIENADRVTDILARHRDQEEIKFQWRLLKNIVGDCQCYISGAYIEISPYVNPIQQFGSFDKATHRILMSATTMNDSFFIKGLNIGKSAVKNPLTVKNERWSGEKMILIPYLIHESLGRIAVINQYARPNTSKNFGIVSLVPSFKHSRPYAEQGCTISNHNTIDQEIQELKNGHFEKPLVIANRYDGIDLPDATCRLLILDSKPYSESLSDKYEEQCREESNLTNIKIAQKIEQGLGRSVRGQKDYSVIVIIGGDLVNFIRKPQNEKYFSLQTKRQIQIGYEIAELAKEDVDPETTDMMKIVTDLIRQCITSRDLKWKRFYEERMDEALQTPSVLDITDILEMEKIAEDFNLNGMHSEACNVIQEYVNRGNLPISEYGWYLQMMARFKYVQNKTESNTMQIGAFKKNRQLLKPAEGFTYKKISLINISRVSKIREFIREHGNYEALHAKILDIYASLSFEEIADHFEEAVDNLGTALGFETQRPDKESKEGPDNLWALAENDYLLFECKNEVEDKREEINKSETGQINTSCGWFKNNYSGATFKPVMVINTKNISKQGAFNFEVEILRKSGLKSLRNNFKSFYDALQKYDLDGLTDSLIQEQLLLYKLDNSSIKGKYTDKPYQR